MHACSQFVLQIDPYLEAMTYAEDALTWEEDEKLMKEELAEIKTVDEAIDAYRDCIIDKEAAESQATATCVAHSRWSKGWKDLDQKAYMERLEHETLKTRREGEEAIQAIETYMMMLEQKFGRDIRTAALNKHNENKYVRTDVPQEQTASQARHGNLHDEKLTRSRSLPTIPKGNSMSCPLYYF